MTSYCIVHFIEGNYVDIVPSNWLSGNDLCYWPQVPSWSSKFKNAVQSREQPATDWLNYTIKILKFYETYEKARSMLSTAENTSDLEESSGRVRKRPRKLCDSDSEDVGPINPNVAIRIPTPPLLTTPTRTADKVDSELTELRPVDPLASAESNLQKRANGYAQRLLMRTNVRSSPLSNLNSSQTNSPGSQSSSSTTDYVDQSYENWKPRSTELQENEEHKRFLKYAVEAMESIKTKLAEHSDILSNLQMSVNTLMTMTTSSPDSGVNYSELERKFSMLPITSKDLLLIFDSDLNGNEDSESQRNSLKQFLRHDCKTQSLEDTVAYILKKLLTDDCAFGLTWTSVVDKKERLAGLNLRACLVGAIRDQVRNVNDKQIGTAISAWIKRAHDRKYQKKKKPRNQENSNPIDF